ncbi:hypothetical protein L596_013395 [Steinernema carpocapsae]|uniref:Uncharacterized protein n=1 Tax=Steinernema carpocapsae TaxID=34508 RepID=A0A4U5P0N9_STECR|nr:hypothetical protein L596_013395 [Steinernema carpocapsae]
MALNAKQLLFSGKILMNAYMVTVQCNSLFSNASFIPNFLYNNGELFVCLPYVKILNSTQNKRHLPGTRDMLPSMQHASKQPANVTSKL